MKVLPPRHGGSFQNEQLRSLATSRLERPDFRSRWDNAVAESFFSSLKKERIRKKVYRTRSLAKSDIFEYIEMFYNRTRRHSHLGGSAEAFEAASNFGL